MKQRFQHHLVSIKNLKLFNACEEILDTPEFFTHPASLGFHHAYEGGLLAHTVEVTDIARGMTTMDNGVFPEGSMFNQDPDFDILIAACLWHDFMKIREYGLTDLGQRVLGNGDEDSLDVRERWYHTGYGKLIHHIPGSAIEFTVAARKHGVAEDVIEQVQHCILAHHGRKDWGSPVEPQSLEALVLHQADMLSAKFGATKDVM